MNLKFLTFISYFLKAIGIFYLIYSATNSINLLHLTFGCFFITGGFYLDEVMENYKLRKELKSFGVK